jgi:DUF4097 and DUF4098 domain-containing protein YvlB
MNEQKYLIELEIALKTLNPNERKDILRDIKEYFENEKKEGKSVDDIISSFGPAEEIAAELLKAYSEEEFVQIEKLEPIDAEEFQNVQISADGVNVILKPSNDNRFYYNVIDSKEKTNVHIKNMNGVLHVNITRQEIHRKLWFFKIVVNAFSDATVTLQIPEKLYNHIKIYNDNGFIKLVKLQSKDVTLETDNGRIELDNILANDGEFKTDNGRILGNHCNFTSIYAETDNGRIEFSNSNINTSKLRTDNGRIELESLIGEIDARTDNGRIEMHVPKIEHSIHLETDMGNIQLSTDQVMTDGSIRAETDMGKVEIYGQSSRKIVYGNGNPKVNLITDMGKIIVGLKSEIA